MNFELLKKELVNICRSRNIEFRWTYDEFSRSYIVKFNKENKSCNYVITEKDLISKPIKIIKNEIYLNTIDLLKKSNIKFELGRYYRHTTGTKLHICCLIDTYYHGVCLVGENENGELIPVGNDESNTVNFTEITIEEFLEVSLE